ncbi:hypothetical protein [Glycomyces sp. YM15]|uniref:hypothetical protein n=1 Tax=Glycomyces sp. YM15 TaxID=2800446 RepID=UPI0019661E54|nr:hypothetical protein [Glycomyces sp. YM15]
MAATALVCIDANTAYEYGPCQGPVHEYDALSGSGYTYARCTFHYDAYCDRMAPILKRWPDTPHPPAWFDPTYAGETWDEDY